VVSIGGCGTFTRRHARRLFLKVVGRLAWHACEFGLSLAFDDSRVGSSAGRPLLSEQEDLLDLIDDLAVPNVGPVIHLSQDLTSRQIEALEHPHSLVRLMLTGEEDDAGTWIADRRLGQLDQLGFRGIVEIDDRRALSSGAHESSEAAQRLAEWASLFHAAAGRQRSSVG
jgi:hypothetical protein